MSKSLGNGVDPLEVIDKYGADALRSYCLLQVTHPVTICAGQKQRLQIPVTLQTSCGMLQDIILMNLP